MGSYGHAGSKADSKKVQHVLPGIVACTGGSEAERHTDWKATRAASSTGARVNALYTGAHQQMYSCREELQLAVCMSHS